MKNYSIGIEKNPAHKIFFQIACQAVMADFTASAVNGIIPAGTLVASNGATAIEAAPTVKVIPATATKCGGVLAHDVIVADGAEQSVGVIIRGVVYDDVITGNRTVIATGAPGITVYAAKTL